MEAEFTILDEQNVCFF